MIIAENEEGRLEFIGNELVITDKTEGDAVAVRGRGHNKAIVKYGIDAARPEGVEGTDEIGFLLGERDERYSQEPGRAAGQFTFQLRRPDMGSVDAAMRKVMAVRHDGVILYGPNGEELDLTPGGSSRGSDILQSENGRYQLVMQNDGNLVIYDRQNGPIWASNTDR